MTPAVSVHAASSWSNTLAQDLVLWRSLGVSTVSLMAAKCAAPGAAASIREAGLRVATVGVRAGLDLSGPPDPAATTRIEQAIALAAEVAAPVVYLSSGRAGGLSPRAAVSALGHRLAPVTTARLAIETSPPSRPDLGFVHTLKDACEVAKQLGLGVVYDVCASWAEPGLEDVIRRNLDRIITVQVADRPLTQSPAPNRLVPGDGDLPLRELIATLARAGYRAPVELELIGPEIDRIGYEAALTRALAYLTTLLDKEYQ